MKHTLVALILALSACGPGSMKTERKDGLVVEESLTPAAQLALAEERLAANPDDPRAQLELATALSKMDPPSWRRAEPHARAAFDSGELDAKAGRLLGKIYWEVGQPLETVDAWRTARASDPDAVLDSDFLYALVIATEQARLFKHYETWYALRKELVSFAASNPEVIESSPSIDTILIILSDEYLKAVKKEARRIVSDEILSNMN